MSRLAFLFWLLLVPALVGVLTGACVSLLVGGIERWGLHQLSHLPGIVPALFAPLGLLLTWLIGKWVTRAQRPSTSELYITLYHQAGARLPLEQVPGRVLATTATVGLGGAQGFESTSALVGASWSELVGRMFRRGLTVERRQALFAAGASAGIAAVFSSPAAGALYGIEVPFKRRIDAPKLVPCVVAAVTSFAVRVWLIGEQRIINVSGMPTLDGLFLVGVLLVACLCGLGARLFATVEAGLQHLGRQFGPVVRALIGGCLLSGVAIAGYYVCGRWITFGSGYVASGWLQAEPQLFGLLVLAFLIRAGANLLTVFGGGGGGVFTSLACNGAFIGEIVARTLNCDQTHTLALFGAACFLGAGYRLPLACMLFIAEATIGPMLTGVGLIAVALAFGLMGDASVSDAQTDEE